MSEDLSLNDVIMPKCYTRVLWIYDYKIDEQLSPSKRSRSSQDTNDLSK